LESELSLLDEKMHAALMVNRNVNYAYDLIDKLKEIREMLLNNPLDYSEIDRERRITNYLFLALEEFIPKK
jgi:hypothetical protein